MRWSAPSRSFPVEATALAAVLLVAALLSLAPAAAVSLTLPPLSAGATQSLTLYGNAANGWGTTAENITRPGPHLYVAYGDTVELTLYSQDTILHNWFLDYDNNTRPSQGEPKSPDFQGTTAIVWRFTPDRVGTFIYRCEYHFGTMWGYITISAPTRYVLWGHTTEGWGFDRDNMSEPGPTLIVQQGVEVTLTLYSKDGIDHTWFIDYNNDSLVSPGEQESPRFTGGSPINYTFVADRAGTFTYRCGIHLRTMTGTIIVLGTGGGPVSQGLGIALIPGMMVATIVGVLILAAVYQIRATRNAKRTK